MFIIWHKPGRIYVDLTNLSHHFLVTLKTCQGIQCFFFILLLLFYYYFLYNYWYENHFIKPNIHLFCMTKRVHLVTIAIHLCSFSKVVHHIHGLKAGKLQNCFSKDAGCRNQSTLTMSCECLAYPCWYFSAPCKRHLLISQKLNPVRPYNCVYLLLLYNYPIKGGKKEQANIPVVRSRDPFQLRNIFMWKLIVCKAGTNLPS